MSLKISISQSSGKSVVATSDTKLNGASRDLRGFISHSRHKHKSEDLRSRLEKHKADRMGIEEEPPRMRSRWDDEGDDGGGREEVVTAASHRHHNANEPAKQLNKENARDKKSDCDEKKKKKVDGAEKPTENDADVGENKKKKKKRHSSRSPPVEKKTSRSSRSRSRGRKRSKTPTKSRRPLTEKLSEKLESRDRRDRRREGSPDREHRMERKRKHSPDRQRATSPSVSRKDKERKRSSPRSRSRSGEPASVKAKSKEKKEKKHYRSVSKEKEVKKKKKKNKEKRDKSENKVRKESKKEKKLSPKKDKAGPDVVVANETSTEASRGGREESETERKRRKSRVDSGISTGSGLGSGGGQEQQPKEKKQEEPQDLKQPLSSKVSDSPLSGPSLSPTPPRSPEHGAETAGPWGLKESCAGTAAAVPLQRSLLRAYSESPSPPRRQEADSTAAGLDGLMQWGRAEVKGEMDVDNRRVEVEIRSRNEDHQVFDEFPGEERRLRRMSGERDLEKKETIADHNTAAAAEQNIEDKFADNQRRDEHEYKVDHLEKNAAPFDPEEEERRRAEEGRDRRGRDNYSERAYRDRGDSHRHRRHPEDHTGERYRGEREGVVERPRDRRRNRSLERRERSRERASRRRRERTPDQRREDRSPERRSRSIERRSDWDRRDYGVDRDRYGTSSSRRFSDEEYRSRRGGERYSTHRDYQRRYSCEYSRQISTASLVDTALTSGLDWTEKVQMFIESTRSSTLVELTRDTTAAGQNGSGGVLPSFDPSKPPPLLMAANPVPDYAAVAAYTDPTVPSLDGTTSSLVTPDIAALYTPYPQVASQTHQQPSVVMPQPVAPLMGLPPPTSAAAMRQSPPQEMTRHRYEPVHATATSRQQPSAAAHHTVAEPLYPPEIHTAVSIDEQRASREREMKPLTAKEKKRLDMGQKEVWQYVGRKIFTDKIFLSRRKKKGGTCSPEEDKEELKKAEKCAVRLAMKLEKAGYSETRLWHLLKDNQKGIQGFYDEMRTSVISGVIEVDRDAKKPKEKLDADLLLDGTVFKYIGEYIQANPFQMNKTRRTSSAESGAATISPQPLQQDPRLMQQQQGLPSTNDLQNILQFAKSLQPPVAASASTQAARPPRPDQLVAQEGESAQTFALRSLADLRNFIAVQLVRTLKMEVAAASDMAAHYAETLAIAGFNYLSLRDTIVNYRPPEPEFEGEPVQSVYGHLLECLRDLAFEKYPKALSETSLDTHLTNIVRISLDYFTRDRRSQTRTPSPTPRPSVRTVGEEEPGFIGPMPPSETVPVGGNTVNQLPMRRYILVSVSVDTVPVEGRLVVWQISVHIPSLPDNEDPDYECLMLPAALRDGRPDLMADLGFTYDAERGNFYHQGTEYGRRKAEPEEVSLEKFTNYLDEIRGGLRGAGKNNGLVLLFETGEDLALMQQLLSRHSHDIFLDVVKGVACLDHFLRISRRAAAYTWPAYQYRVGEGGRWTASLAAAGSASKRIEAETKPECIYNICESLLGAPPGFNNFIKWYAYPVFHGETSRMTASLEHILELLPLQNHIDRQLHTNRVQVVLEGVYAARSEVEAARPHNACARQTVRRLVALGFTLDVLKKSFGADPNYEIPSSVFLQDMTEVQKLRVHSQTDLIRGFIKHYFVRSA